MLTQTQGSNTMRARLRIRDKFSWLWFSLIFHIDKCSNIENIYCPGIPGVSSHRSVWVLPACGHGVSPVLTAGIAVAEDGERCRHPAIVWAEHRSRVSPHLCVILFWQPLLLLSNTINIIVTSSPVTIVTSGQKFVTFTFIHFIQPSLYC